MEVIWGEYWIKSVTFCCKEMSKLCLESIIDKDYHVMFSRGEKDKDCFLFNKKTSDGMRVNYCPFCGEKVKHGELMEWR